MTMAGGCWWTHRYYDVRQHIQHLLIRQFAEKSCIEYEHEGHDQSLVHRSSFHLKTRTGQVT